MTCYEFCLQVLFCLSFVYQKTLQHKISAFSLKSTVYDFSVDQCAIVKGDIIKSLEYLEKRNKIAQCVNLLNKL